MLPYVPHCLLLLLEDERYYPATLVVPTACVRLLYAVRGPIAQSDSYKIAYLVRPGSVQIVCVGAMRAIAWFPQNAAWIRASEIQAEAVEGRDCVKAVEGVIV